MEPKGSNSYDERKLLGEAFHRYLPSKVLLSYIPLGSMYTFLNVFEITLD